MPKSAAVATHAQTPAQKKNLIILVLIMLVNALAYGIIIPLLYPYATRFGINALGLSLLVTGFSVAQFIATPILGRLSDKFGRKPVLLFCLFGTSLSLALFASATSVAMLFIARIVDGITGGNISVAQAVIADSTKGSERAKAFGLLGASFGFGFLVGPALGGVLSGYGLATPFWFASALALVGTLLGIVIMKETLPKGKRQSQKKALFNIKGLFGAIFLPATGIVLLLNLLAAIAQNSFFIGIQSAMTDIFRLNTLHISLVLTGIGLISIVMQVAGLPILLKLIPHKKWIVSLSFVLSTIAMAGLFAQSSITFFVINLFLLAIAMAPIVPVITGLLSERTKAEDQGIILGINQSYTSIGQIIGPVSAGLVATRSIPSTFLVAAAFMGAGVLASAVLYNKPDHKVDV